MYCGYGLLMKKSAFGVAFPIFTGSQSGDFFKGIGKVMGVMVSDVIANLGNRVIGIGELGFGLLHFGLNNELLNGSVGPFAEIGSQIFFIVSKIICHIRYF